MGGFGIVGSGRMRLDRPFGAQLGRQGAAIFGLCPDPADDLLEAFASPRDDFMPEIAPEPPVDRGLSDLLRHENGAHTATSCAQRAARVALETWAQAVSCRWRRF